MVFVVAGATGNVGSAVVRELAQSTGAEVRALTRSSRSEKVAPFKDMKQVQVVEVDISDEKADLTSAFAGATAAFLSCANFRGQVQAEKNFIDAAVASGCTYLVKLGTVRCYTALDSSSEYARFHAEIEEYLEEKAGEMKWTVLSPNWFMTNHLGDIFGTLSSNIIAYPVDTEATATIVDPRDVGYAAARLLLAPDCALYHGLKLDMSGPESISIAQVAALYTTALGRPVAHVHCPPEAWVAGAVQGGLPEWLAQAVVLNFQYWEQSRLSFPTSPQLLALAPPQRTMAQWIGEWAPRSPPPQN